MWRRSQRRPRQLGGHPVLRAAASRLPGGGRRALAEAGRQTQGRPGALQAADRIDVREQEEGIALGLEPIGSCQVLGPPSVGSKSRPERNTPQMMARALDMQ